MGNTVEEQPDVVIRYRKRGNGPRMVAMSAVLRGRVINLDGELTVGAAKGSGYVISGASMADNHVKIKEGEDHWAITTIDDQAKLWVNDEPVQFAVLCDEDEVTIGKHSFLFFES